MINEIDDVTRAQMMYEETVLFVPKEHAVSCFYRAIKTVRAEAMRKTLDLICSEFTNQDPVFHKEIDTFREHSEPRLKAVIEAAILEDKPKEESPLARRLVQVYNSRLPGCNCPRCRDAVERVRGMNPPLDFDDEERVVEAIDGEVKQ